MARDLIKQAEGRDLIRVTPETAGWQSLAYGVHALGSGESLELDTNGRESAIVTISGTGVVVAGSERFELGRADLFAEPAPILYVPPGDRASVEAGPGGEYVFAVGSAPAEGRYPLALIKPAHVAAEVRGGGAALRQVNHILAPPLPAERLIVYEVIVPGGSWAGWPPHCHDGEHGSPYLEETYYFRFDRPEGFGFHRNYVEDRSFDEVFTVDDGDCVAVPRGFHVTTASPGANMWILNFLAGELQDEDRSRPPYFDPATTWITADWSKGQLPLPVGAAAGALGGGK